MKIIIEDTSPEKEDRIIICHDLFINGVVFTGALSWG
jgi:hypothetical protein